MINLRGKNRKIKIIFKLLLLSSLLGGLFVLSNFALAEAANYVVISEIQITGAISTDEFIELYNPTENPIDLVGWKLTKKTASGNESNLLASFPIKNIPAHGYFLIVHKTGYQGTTPSDVTFSGDSYNIANNNTVILYNAENQVIDRVGLGSANDFEGMAVANPAASQSVERKPSGELGNGEDTNNNFNDFFIQTLPNPQNSNSLIQPPLAEPLPTEPPPVEPSPPVESPPSTEPTTPAEPPVELPQGTTALPGEVVINEIMWDGAEYLELYNTTDREIVLTNWTISDDDGLIYTFTAADKISARGYFLIEDSTDGTSVSENVVTPITLNNSDGELIILKDSAGTIIDSANQMTGGWLAGANTETGDSMERKSLSGDGTKTENWHTSVGSLGGRIGTPGQANSSGISEPQQPTPANQELTDLAKQQPIPATSGGSDIYYQPGVIVINEFIADPGDGEVEWIELYLTNNQIIDLTGWALEDGSETVTRLSGTIGFTAVIPRFKVIEKPKGNLNNKGDAIFLKDPSGKIIDRVVYGDWSDGEISDNAPATEDPYSIARIKDGQDTNNDLNDWRITTKPTKGLANIILASTGLEISKTNSSSTTSKPPAGSLTVIINEILPNPDGPDTTEFIELKNIGTSEIDLVGWQITDNSSVRYLIDKKDFKTTRLGSGGFFVLYREQTKIALNNTGGESVKLYSPEDELIDIVNYGGQSLTSQSFARGSDNQWHWTTAITPGKENIISVPNSSPKAVIEVDKKEALVGEEIKFDASDSYDPEGDKLTYLWRFGSAEVISDSVNPTYSYEVAGDYEVKLIVSDSQSLKDEAVIKIVVGNHSSNHQTVMASSGTSGARIVISEFLPNPKGSDAQEWIEIFNRGDGAVDLTGWKLDDEEGGSQGYLIPKQTIIQPKQYLVFKKSETGLTLNNIQDMVRLINPAGDIVSEVDYTEVLEGASYAFSNNEWRWTGVLTPSEENIIETPGSGASRGSDSKKIITTTLEKIREQDKGDKVRVKGVVAVEPGILGKTVSYLAGSGIQIYMAKQDWPTIKLGDYVEVAGVLSESNEETRINVQDKSNLKILSHQEPPQPHSLKIGDINEEKEGNLVTVAGEVVDKKGNNLYLDDGSDEIRLYIKSSTNISSSEIKTGDQVVATGIISQTKSGYRLLPRYQDDLKVIHLAVAGASQAAEEGELIIPAYDPRREVMRYLLVAVVALSIILIGLLKKYNTERQDQAVAPEVVPEAVMNESAAEVEVIALPPPKNETYL